VKRGEAVAEANVQKVKRNLGTYVSKFEGLRREWFCGPDLHFHEETIRICRSHSRPLALLEDEQYFQYLYATLTAWDLHWPGPKGPKLQEYEKFKKSARGLFNGLSDLLPCKLLTISRAEAERIGERLGSAIAQHEGLSGTHARLVVNSKAVHHFLPDLSVPVDRRYVLKCFRGVTDIARSQEKPAFTGVFLHYHAIAHFGDNAAVIENALSRSKTQGGLARWHTSQTKVLDNAVIAYGMSQDELNSK